MSSANRDSVSWSVTWVAVPHNFTSPSVTILSAVAVCRANRPSRLRSRDLVESAIIPSHSRSSCKHQLVVGEHRLHRADAGKPSRRRVANIISPVAASRLSVNSAISGASAANSVQVAIPDRTPTP